MYYLGESLTCSPHGSSQTLKQDDLTSFLPWILSGHCCLLGQSITCIKIRRCSVWKLESTCTQVWPRIHRRLGGRGSLPVLLVKLSDLWNITCRVRKKPRNPQILHHSPHLVFFEAGCAKGKSKCLCSCCTTTVTNYIQGQIDSRSRRRVVISRYHPTLPSVSLRL